LFIAPSRYFGELMRGRLELAADRVRVIHNGINLEGYRDDSPPVLKEGNTSLSGRGNSGPVLGYLARMCREKGLDTLTDAYIKIRKRGRVADLRLCVAGSLGSADEPLVRSLKRKLGDAGLQNSVEFYPNVDHPTKLALLKSFSVFSVPALYGEGFGLYVIEAQAAGTPVVQPNCAAFPELVQLTGGGVLYNPSDPEALADGIEDLLLNPERARALGATGRKAVFEKLSAETMARNVGEALKAIEGCVASR
jgi:glycosyltransferase involved in cell wall biosynthesis